MGKEETALGSARARFVEGLPRKAQELGVAVALLLESPGEDRPREELRRRLHALYASAQVFRIDALAGALKEAIGRLDAVRAEARPATEDDLDALATLAATLPGLGGDLPEPVAEAEAEAPEQPEDPINGAMDAVDALDALDAPRPSVVLEGVEDLVPDEPRQEPSPPQARRPSRRPGPLSTVLSVLVVDEVESQVLIRELLPAEGFELVAASDPEAALRLARRSAPDVVLLENGILEGEGADFISRLHSDPLTDFVPVVVLLPDGAANDLVAVGTPGAVETICKPLDRESLVRVLVRVTGASEAVSVPLVGSYTASELADRLADEVRRGIADATEQGRDVRIPIGDGSALLAAAWSAIARVRAHVARESGGKVTFRDAPHRGPAHMALTEGGRAAEEAGGDEVSLEGRRIIVADDDPAVVWFFAGLFREEGAIVYEAEDGRMALEEARRRRPDVVVSDILMPELDGFALCRAFERDPSLSDVPVILLSWKEDFLQRMRDLHAGARGYLRKEAGTAQILARVRQVLRPRARVEEQLRAGGEVRGRTDGLGVVGLLRAVSDLRPDARVTVRDAWNLYEVDLRAGDVVDLTCTATDGAFLRGPRALPQLIGVTSARFTVDVSDAEVMKTIYRPIDRLLSEACAHLGALVESVSGKALPVANEVELDADALDSFVRTSPAPIQAIVEKLRDGASPRELLMSGDVAPGNLESALIGLARRGAIRAVRGASGEDRVALALEARRDGRDIPSERPIEPPEPVESPEGARESEIVGEDPKTAEPTAVDIRPGSGFMEALRDEAQPASDSKGYARDDSEAEEYSESEDDFLRISGAAPPRDSVPSLADLGSQYPPPRNARREAEATMVDPVQAVDDSLLSPAKASRDLASMADAVTRPPAYASAEDDEPGLLGWVTMLVIFGLVGFIGMSIFSRSCGSEATTAPSPAASERPAAPTPDGGAAAAPRQAAATARPDELSYGRTLDSVDAGPGVRVGANQGLLVIEAGEGRAPQVFIGPRSLGRVPVREVLPEGRHELRFRRGDEESFRFVYVQAGKTRIVPPL
ncbi:MAG: response regulator [Deltaproteobacteria bacterium]|nr:response regulator [Deltaproteobacteria bacterium]